ncbi:hypothetical protein KEM48_014357 [Puccinia striiformis f. sp. tritici PST-130]|nr:hypothetical protein KEM48_014357 [Puccinia striiformis f. sp. tritici PST-130]
MIRFRLVRGIDRYTQGKLTHFFLFRGALHGDVHFTHHCSISRGHSSGCDSTYKFDLNGQQLTWPRLLNTNARLCAYLPSSRHVDQSIHTIHYQSGSAKNKRHLVRRTGGLSQAYTSETSPAGSGRQTYYQNAKNRGVASRAKKHLGSGEVLSQASGKLQLDHLACDADFNLDFADGYPPRVDGTPIGSLMGILPGLMGLGEYRSTGQSSNPRMFLQFSPVDHEKIY